MELYLMRHADAVNPSDWNRDDASRPLSDVGRDRLKKALPDIQKARFSPALILTSPFVRAKETADAVCTLFPGKSAISRTPLASGASISALRAEVVGEKDQPSLLIIGHMPELAHFASGIVGDPWLMEEGRMDPAAMWALDPGDLASGWGKGKFLWRRNLEDWKRI